MLIPGSDQSSRSANPRLRLLAALLYTEQPTTTTGELVEQLHDLYTFRVNSATHST